MFRRREVVFSMAAAAALIGSPARAATRPKRVLVLGGTNYVGPHIVLSALQAGHEVTLFNRGTTNPHLFPSLERIRGDRIADNGLAALAGPRRWDAVIDTWAGSPRAVEASTALLRDRVERYAYISSIAVYGSFRTIGLTEADPPLSLAQRPAGDADDVGYAWAKRLAEYSVERHFPRTSLIARGSSIFGFDVSGRPDNQSAYWPLRIRAGGRVLAPGDGRDLIQYTDAGSLADFVIRMIDAGGAGTFNVANAPISFRTYLETLTAVSASAAELVWVPQDFLMANGGIPFEKVPLWIPADDPEPGFFRFDTTRALAAGMPVCGLDKTAAAVFQTFADRPRSWQPDWNSVGGMPADLERAILDKWDWPTKA